MQSESSESSQGAGGVSSKILVAGREVGFNIRVSIVASSGACRTPSLPSTRTHSPHTRLQSSSPGVSGAAAPSSGTAAEGSIWLAQEEQRTVRG